MGDQQTLQGTIEKVVYRSEENGFSVLTVRVAKRQITVTGCLPSLHAGEQASFKGSWGFHQKFGRQFVAESALATLPATALGIQKYLGSGLIKGIGPTFAKRLVSTFGEKTLEVIESEPERLLEVNGVGPKRVQRIKEAWKEQKDISDIMVFLHGHQVSSAFAVKIYKQYGNSAITVVQENPYKLSEDIWGVGFKTADKIALNIGLDKHSIQRVQAGVLHEIAQVVDKGSLYIELEGLKAGAITLLELESDAPTLLKKALKNLYNKGKIKLVSVDDTHYISLPQYYFSEKGIAAKIKTLQSGSTQKFDLDHVYKMLRKKNKIVLNDDQQHGIMSCLQNKISIITGGPGTGKTTLVKTLLDVLDHYKVKYRLAAPTGRASKRMLIGTGRNTETIHRLLEFTPASMGFARNEQHALELDFLIVDEASMIDVFLMHAILRAMPQHAHLLLLGDVDQLPSVGAGNILRDLIESHAVHVVKLTEIFRQAQDSLIVVNAHRINSGDMPVSFLPNARKDFLYIKEQVPERVFDILRDVYKTKLAGIKPEESIVLTPMNRGIVGTQRLNQELQMILNPQETEKKISRFGQEYKVGDRVMQVRNNYTKFVFNGDIGYICDIDFANREIKVNFGDRTLVYDFNEIDELVLAYAVSIHKSQGSEFSAVIIPLFMQHFILLQRNLIYTAITRAKKLCVLIGQTKAIAIGINNNKVSERKTFLKEYLTTDLEAR